MDLSGTIGGSRYLKRLNQAVTSTEWPGTILPADTWVEALSLTGKHLIDMVVARNETSSSICYAKYEIDGVMSAEREIRNNLSMLLIGLGSPPAVGSSANNLVDVPQYAKASFKVFVKRTPSGTAGMTFSARYSQVSVEPME